MGIERPCLPALEYNQRKKEETLDRILFLISGVSLFIVTSICMDIPAGALYYLQEDITRKYLGGLSRVDRYAYYISKWHLLVMSVGAYGLLYHYPSSYSKWLEQKEKMEKSNPLFTNAAYGMILVFSFILHLTKAPHGFIDSTVLHIYQAVSIGLIILTVLINHVSVYFIRQKKSYEYCGVDDHFCNGFCSVYIFCLIASEVMIHLVLPWACL